jgi:hypothetical protein
MPVITSVGCFVPSIGTVKLDRELALVLFLPPPLQASAYRTDWPAFRANLAEQCFIKRGAARSTVT